MTYVEITKELLQGLCDELKSNYDDNEITIKLAQVFHQESWERVPVEAIFNYVDPESGYVNWTTAGFDEAFAQFMEAWTNNQSLEAPEIAFYSGSIPPYARSVDHALKLIKMIPPRGDLDLWTRGAILWPGYDNGRLVNEYKVVLTPAYSSGSSGMDVIGYGATMPLAICDAVLRVMMRGLG